MADPRKPYGQRSYLLSDTPPGAPKRLATPRIRRNPYGADTGRGKCRVVDCNERRKNSAATLCAYHQERQYRDGDPVRSSINYAATRTLRALLLNLLARQPDHPAITEGIHILRRMTLINRDGRKQAYVNKGDNGRTYGTYTAAMEPGALPATARAWKAGPEAARAYLAEVLACFIFLRGLTPTATGRYLHQQLGRCAHRAAPAHIVSSQLGLVRFFSTRGVILEEGKFLATELLPFVETLEASFAEATKTFPGMRTPWGAADIKAATEGKKAPVKTRKKIDVANETEPPVGPSIAIRIRARVRQLREQAQSTTTNPQE